MEVTVSYLHSKMIFLATVLSMGMDTKKSAGNH